MKYDAIVIGSGPAGCETAMRLAAADKRVALITVTPPGGRTTVGSLLPSKVWLQTAHQRRPRSARLSAEETQAAAAGVRNTIQKRVEWTQQQLESAGVTIFTGNASLIETGRVSYTPAGQDGTSVPEPGQLHADHIVLATGSEPTFTADVRPDGRRIIAPRHTKMLSEIPESLIMIGGGVTGIEYGEAFARLGAQVTLLSAAEILPRFDREYVARLTDHLHNLGITMYSGRRVTALNADERSVSAVTQNGTRYQAAMAFVATGRAADLSCLGTSGEPSTLLAQLVDTAGRFIATDACGRTALPGIYACGDAAGPPFTANHALDQARHVAEAILTPAAPCSHTPLIEAVFTDPQLAQISSAVTTDQQPQELSEQRRSFTASMLSAVRAGGSDTLSSDTLSAELKLLLDVDGMIVQATAIGTHAAEVLAPVQLAMHHGISWQALNAVPFAYPTWTEIVTA